jgi:hypothetical protein
MNKQVLVSQIIRIDRKQTDRCNSLNPKYKWFYEYHHEQLKIFWNKQNDIEYIKEFLVSLIKEQKGKQTK